MKGTYTLLSIILISLLALSASAQVPEDFSLSGDTAFTVYQGTLHSTSLLVTNTGAVASSYSLSVGPSDAANWVSMNPLTFTLQPGQSKTITEYLNIPLNTAPGSYSLTTFVTTSVGSQASLKQRMSVEIPHNIYLTAEDHKSILPCGTATYPITISNIGPFPDTYTLSISSNVADIASFNDDEFVLAPNTFTTAWLSITPPVCDVSGPLAFEVTGTAATTNAQEVLPLELTVTNPFIPSVTFDDLRMTSEKTSVNVTVANTGTETTTYTLTVTDTDVAKVTPTKVTIPADSETTVVLSAQGDIDQAKYPGTLSIGVNNLAYDFPFLLNIKDYTWLETHVWIAVLILIALIIVVLGAVILVLKWISYTKTPEYQAKKAENARIAAELKKQRDAENAEKAKAKAKAKAEKEKAREKARKEKETERKKQEAEREKAKKAKAQAALDAKIAKEHAKAKKEAERELKATNVLVSKETLKGDTVVRHGKGFWWVLLILLLVAAGVVAYGFRTYLLANQAASIAGLVILLVAIFIIILFMLLRGTKTVKQSWTALKPRKEHQIETGWKAGLGQLWLRVKDVVPNVTVTLRASRTCPAPIAPEGVVYQYINVAADGLPADVIDNQRFVFRVKRSWLDRNEVAEGNIKLVRDTPDGWKGVGTEKVRSDKKWVYYKAEAVGLTVFAIVGKSRTEKKPVSGIAPGWWFVLLGIIIIAAIFGGAWYLAHSGNRGSTIVGVAPVATGIPPQVWDEDTRLTLDLGAYFNDPDGDALAYTYTPVDHIIVTLSGNTATLTPEKDWHGTGTITFTATDGKGGKVSSNKVALTVNDVPEPTFWTNLLSGLEHYSLYIIAGIIILVVLIAMLEYRRAHAKA